MENIKKELFLAILKVIFESNCDYHTYLSARCGIFPRYLDGSRYPRIPHSILWYSVQLMSRQVSLQYCT